MSSQRVTASPSHFFFVLPPRRGCRFHRSNWQRCARSDGEDDLTSPTGLLRWIGHLDKRAGVDDGAWPGCLANLGALLVTSSSSAVSITYMLSVVRGWGALFCVLVVRHLSSCQFWGRWVRKGVRRQVVLSVREDPSVCTPRQPRRRHRDCPDDGIHPSERARVVEMIFGGHRSAPNADQRSRGAGGAAPRASHRLQKKRSPTSA